MIKYFLIPAIAFLVSCQPNRETKSLRIKIDSLEKAIAESYKPGLGEFMTDIQLHHAKLWFAGINNNWGLADFELKEINESLDDIRKYCADRTEVKSIDMISAPLDSLTHSIGNKNQPDFRKGFILLTNTCNTCHDAVKFPFNKIKIPDALPVSNQEFR